MRMQDASKLIAGLQAFGLDKREARLYLASLRKGPASVLELSRATHLPRTTIYPLLDRLAQEGVFRTGKQKNRAVYIAEEPGVLERRLRERQATFSQITDELSTIEEIGSLSPSITYYEGTEGLKRLWRRIYRSGVKEYHMMTTGVGFLEYVKKPYLIKQIIGDRVKQKIMSYQLLPENRYTKEIVASDANELRESRFLPADIQLPATIILFGQEVAFVTTRKENAMILVTSGDIAVSLRSLFSLLWQCAKMPEHDEGVWGAGGA